MRGPLSAAVRKAVESGTGQTAPWLAERKWSERYARPDRLSVVGHDGGEVRIVVEHVKDWRGRDVVEVEPEPASAGGRGRR